MCAALALTLAFVLCTPAAARVDTRTWLGAAYAPAAAPGDLWIASPFFESYAAASIDRELAAAARHLRTTVVRVFLHTLAYEADAASTLDNVDSFLRIASGRGIRTGLVLFDACWNTAGASASTECLPVKGKHNGCWFESPQAADMTVLSRYEPYVTDVVRRFGNDSRVAWLEIYNEPRAPNADFVFALRDAGYRWATALAPTAPIISCWDDNNDTTIVDHHDYGPAFASEWKPAVYVNPTKGAVITEAGSRWYEPPFPGDQGSTLLVINFLEALSARAANGTVPFVPGAMISWEVMVGNSHTRWHWNSPDGAPEPAIPWCGNLYPDGSPVSYTEAAALRRYASGVSEFFAFEKFIPDAPALIDGDFYLVLPPGSTHTVAVDEPIGDALVEASLWLDKGGSVSLIVRATGSPEAGAGGVRTRIEHAPQAASRSPTRSSKRHAAPAARAAAAAQFTAATRSSPAVCAWSPLLNNTDACSGGPPGYRDLTVADAPDATAACAAACCAWAECTAWVMRDLKGTDGNCTDTLCCWLKPACESSETRHFVGAIAQFRAPTPGPPLPRGIGGYNATLDATTNTLTLSRCTTNECVVLAVFDTTTLENGIVLGAWNMLRLMVETDATTGAVSLRVWFNPMVPETGFTGVPAVDARLTPSPLPPRISVVDKLPLPPGGVVLAGGGADARADYVSALPTSVF